MKTFENGVHEFVRSMRRKAIYVHIAVEENVAEDISKCLNQGASYIESLESQIRELKESLDQCMKEGQ